MVVDSKRPWINLQVDGGSILRCKNTDLIVNKISEFNKPGFTSLEIDSCVYWLALNTKPSKLTAKRAINKALKIHTATDVIMEIRHSTRMYAFGRYRRRDGARKYSSFCSKDPNTTAILIQRIARPVCPTDEIKLSISSSNACWGEEYTLPYNDPREWNQAFATSKGMLLLAKHLKYCMDLHESFYVKECDDLPNQRSQNR